jgi:hypothetical protein
MVVVAVLLAVGASVALLTPGGALTGPTPAAPVSIAFSTPITNLSNGNLVTFQATVTGGTTSNVAAHLCKTPPGGPISNTGDFGFGGLYCVKSDGIVVPGLGDNSTQTYESSVPQANLAVSTPVSLKAGTGTVGWLNDDGIPLSLTCDSANPCDLVIEVQINVSPFTTYFTQPLTYAASPAVPAAPTNVTAVAGDGNVLVGWDRDTTANPPVDNYVVTVTPAVAGSPFTVPQPGSGTGVSLLVGGLTNGTPYQFQVHAHNSIGDSDDSSASATPQALERFVFQPINVTRPEGALVMTQACATPNPYPDENPPVGDVSDVVYGTSCSVDLGAAKLIKDGGQYSGQYFEASGPLHEITIVDTRDTDDGWNVNGILTNTGPNPGDFVSGSHHFSGKNLGWTPLAPIVTPPIPANDTDPAYNQAATEGGVVAPITQGLKGTARMLGAAGVGHGLGIARLNATLRVLVPIFAAAGDYQATLQVTAL